MIVYPNPVRGDKLSIQLPGLIKADYTLKLINSIGQELYSEQINHSGGALSYALPLPAGLQPGIYYVQVTSDAKNFWKKVVIQ